MKNTYIMQKLNSANMICSIEPDTWNTNSKRNFSHLIIRASVQSKRGVLFPVNCYYTLQNVGFKNILRFPEKEIIKTKVAISW